MRILFVHNYYQQPGGEDTVFEAEKTLMKSMGHEVITYVDNNARLNGMNPLKAARNVIWSKESKRNILELIRETKPDIAHFHNTFILISPSAYYACKEMGVPVVQSLHNQRIFCAKATMYRNGQICDKCVGMHYPLPSLRYQCYQNSLIKTLVVATMIAFHKWHRTWQSKIDLYITATDFFRQKFIQWGLPASKIVVKPHFVFPDPGPRMDGSGNYALFIGRFDPEKGVQTLLRAWKLLDNIPLKIRGEGQLYKEVVKFAERNPNVTLIPRLSRQDIFALIKEARFLVWTSEGWYETFGLVAVEAFACGVPVIASRTGAMTEIVEDGRTGILFNPGDPEDLASKVEWAWEHPEELRRMGQEARSEYEAKYTAEVNYKMLMEIYKLAIERAKNK